MRTKESDLGFPFGLTCASQADAYRNMGVNPSWITLNRISVTHPRPLGLGLDESDTPGATVYDDDGARHQGCSTRVCPKWTLTPFCNALSVTMFSSDAYLQESISPSGSAIGAKEAPTRV